MSMKYRQIGYEGADASHTKPIAYYLFPYMLTVLIYINECTQFILHSWICNSNPSFTLIYWFKLCWRAALPRLLGSGLQIDLLTVEFKACPCGHMLPCIFVSVQVTQVGTVLCTCIILNPKFTQSPFCRSQLEHPDRRRPGLSSWRCCPAAWSSSARPWPLSSPP